MNKIGQTSREKSFCVALNTLHWSVFVCHCRHLVAIKVTATFQRQSMNGQ